MSEERKVNGDLKIKKQSDIFSHGLFDIIQKLCTLSTVELVPLPTTSLGNTAGG